MSDNLFDIAVPDAELEAPAFQPIPTGPYTSKLSHDPGTPRRAIELVSNANGWQAIRLPFTGFTGKDGKTYGRTVAAQFTIKNPNSPKAASIGWQAVVGAAAAFGLTEPTTTPDGKPAQKVTAATPEELVEQFRAMAGTEAEVYLTAGPRMKGGNPVMKQDGSGPFMDNEIKNVRALRASGNGNHA